MKDGQDHSSKGDVWTFNKCSDITADEVRPGVQTTWCEPVKGILKSYTAPLPYFLKGNFNKTLPVLRIFLLVIVI